MNQHLLSQSEINHYHDEGFLIPQITLAEYEVCLLYTSDAADEV